KRVRILRGELQRSVAGHVIFRSGIKNGFHLIIAAIQADDCSRRAVRIDQIVMERVFDDVAEFISTGRKHVAVADTPKVTAAGNGHAAAILLRSVDNIWEFVPGGKMIKLACGLVVPETPSFARIQTD